MKPIYTKATTQFDNSVTIRYSEQERFYSYWHYHDEYEIVFIHASSGIRYVGDSINPYKPGDLVFLGSRLPHVWMNNSGDNYGSENRAASTVIHFKRKFVHNDFFELPMLQKLKNLFEKSARGIKFNDFPGIDEYLFNIQTSSSSEQITSVLNLLTKLCNHKQYEYLSSIEYDPILSVQPNNRLSKVHEYITMHFKEKISLDTLANIAHMTPQAFCRYFKNKTNKTVSTYINDLKIGFSCKLLIDGNLNIEQIAFESGFNSTTFFNRKFKEKMKVTPKAYKKEFKF